MKAHFELRINRLRPLLEQLHASPWRGTVEEVGTGSWILALLQSVEGASQTLLWGRTSYAREMQAALYGTKKRSISRQTVEHWARQNLSTGDTCFSLAVSGSVASSQLRGDCHAWLALALSDGRGWSFHLRLKQPSRLEQQWALGEWGVLLLAQIAAMDACCPAELPLLEGLELELCWAWHLDTFANLLQSLTLLQREHTSLLLFQAREGRLQPLRPLEALRGQKLLIQKGSFNPVTKAHLAMPAVVLNREAELLPLLELSLSNADKGTAISQDIAHRLQMLAFQPWPIALTRTPALYQTAELFWQEVQPLQLDFLCGEDLYQRVFEPRYYQHLAGGLEEGLARLFARGTRLWVCRRAEAPGLSSEAAHAASNWQERCNFLPLNLPVAATRIRQAVARREAGWETWVTPEVAAYIRQQDLYC